MTKRMKITLVVCSILFVLLVLLTFAFSSNSGKTEVNISVAPKDSSLLLDQTKYINSGKNMMIPGDHTIKISRSGFSSQTFKFIVEQGGANTLPVALTPNTADGKTYLNDHSSDFSKIGDLSELKSNVITKATNKKYPLTKDLPVDISPLYIISYGPSVKYPNDPTKIAIIVSSANPADDQLALQSIYRAGFDPSDYEIIFGSL